MTSNIIFDDFQKGNNYDIALFSEQGKRSSQQDCAYVAADDGDVLAIVCDGMGGFNGGQLASSVAVEAFLEYYQYCGTTHDVNSDWMRNAANRIDDIIYNLKDDRGNRLGAGTTLVGIEIKGIALSWISIGDSRAYIKRGNELVQITTDHNYYVDLNRRLSEGSISQEQYMRESVSGEALISFIGMGGLLMMDISENPLKLKKDDVIIICTDGIYRSVSDENLKAIIEQGATSHDIAILIEDVIKAADISEQDNYTGIIITIKTTGESTNG